MGIAPRGCAEIEAVNAVIERIAVLRAQLDQFRYEKVCRGPLFLMVFPRNHRLLLISCYC